MPRRGQGFESILNSAMPEMVWMSFDTQGIILELMLNKKLAMSDFAQTDLVLKDHLGVLICCP